MTEVPSKRSLIGNIDHLLRGGFTRPEDLADGRVGIPTGTLLVACLLLGGFYGAMMGLFGAGTQHPEMVIASALKVPLLFLLTLFVTLPSLYVFSALARSHLRGVDTLRLLLVAIAVNMTVLASFGPVTAFFTFSTESYAFMKLLNVLFFAIAGFIGLGFLRRALDPVLSRSTLLPRQATESKAPPGSEVLGADVPESEEARPTDSWAAPIETPVRRSAPVQTDPARGVFRAWIVIYGIVGAQMGWILRPFIGDPELDFEWFRAKESNIAGGILDSLRELIF